MSIVSIGGRLKFFQKNWLDYTSDRLILEAVSGYRLDFLTLPEKQSFVPAPYKLKPLEMHSVDIEIANLFSKKVIEKTNNTEGFFSNIFTRPKKDGSYRVILDLTTLNKNIRYNHFKMDTFSSAVALVTKDCFMTSIDLKDAYYSVPIAKEHRQYLKFQWKNTYWQFRALPNGLSSGPRLFTKILKPPLAYLRSRGINIVAYLDDTIIMAKTRAQAVQATTQTVKVLTELGFVIHPTKSCLHPTQQITFLGFIIDSTMLRVTLTLAKREEIKSVCQELLTTSRPSIRQVAMVIGKLVASFPAVQYGPLYYRKLESEKIQSLKSACGHFDRPMTLSLGAKEELHWWLRSLDHSFNLISRGAPTLCLTSDASGLGWGATDGNTHTGGRWNAHESLRAEQNEINYLELRAAFFALQSFCTNLNNTHVLIRMDNTTAVAYVNNMGGIKSTACNLLAKAIWEWCQHREIWLTAAYLPGKLNVIADGKSRKFNDQLEWMLHKTVFQDICSTFGTPDIDLFASRNNTQLNRYISWTPDPGSEAVDAFSVDWKPFYFYAFPPFSLIMRCLIKVELDRAEGLLIVPKWPTQPWFPRLLSLLANDPIILPHRKDLLTQPTTGEKHPLKHLSLLCCRLSGSPSKVKAYQKRLQTSYYHHGGSQQSASTTPTYRDGFTFALDNKLIQCKQMK